MLLRPSVEIRERRRLAQLDVLTTAQRPVAAAHQDGRQRLPLCRSLLDMFEP